MKIKSIKYNKIIDYFFKLEAVKLAITVSQDRYPYKTPANGLA